MRGKGDDRDLSSTEVSGGIHPLSPLDPGERRSREGFQAGDRGGLQLQRQPGSAWRKLTRAELGAVAGFPALVVLGIILGASGVPIPVVVVSIAILVLALAAFVFSRRH